jgi:hypothetical protein
MNELTDATTVVRQTLPSTLPTDDKTTELIKSKSDQSADESTKEEEQPKLIIAGSDHAETSASDVTSSGETSCDEQTNANEEIFANVLAKLRALEKRSLEVHSRKSALNDAYHAFVELLNLIDEHKYNTDHNLAARKGLKLLLKLMVNTDPDQLFEKDSIYAMETLYLYLNLLNLSGIRTYFTHGEMNRNSKQLYSKYILPSLILKVLISATTASNFSMQDSQQLSNYNQSLLLMLNYVQAEISSWTRSNCSSVTMSILLFMRSYAEKTVLVSNLIKAGCVEVILKCLTTLHQ